MVGDDDLYSVSVSQLNLRRRSNAVVTSQYHAYGILLRFLYQMIVQTVSVMDTMGNGSVHFGSQHLQSLCQYVGGTDPVHVIIPDHANSRLLFHRFKQQLHRSVHILQKPRGVTIFQRTV